VGDDHKTTLMVNMHRSVDEALRRWIGAGLLDAASAERIRRFESSRQQPAGLRWQVLLALIFGAILLSAGIALFVAAHWGQLSPLSRFLVVIGTLVLIHLIAILVRDHFHGLATVLHGVGTMACGAAIALVGQIFNIQEYWPAGIFLWALCALAGWALLGDEVQQTIALLLLPAWMVCEWIARTDGYRGSELMSVRMIAVIAAVYLTALLGSGRKLVAGVLFAVGAITLAIVIIGLLNFYTWHDWTTTPAPPKHLILLGWGVIVATLLFAWRLKPESVIPVGVVLLAAMVLPHCYFLDQGHDYLGGTWYPTRPSLVAYLIVAALACFFSWCGIRERSKALINYGVISFALTVLWFYFSNFMDKLNRSLGLIVLGILFLGGGWALEKLRRRMVSHVKTQEAA